MLEVGEMAAEELVVAGGAIGLVMGVDGRRRGVGERKWLQPAGRGGLHPIFEFQINLT
jgi:hypothetical protein